MELLSQLYPAFPNIICFSEHHMKHLELHRSHFDNYKLGGSYCRMIYEMGGMHICAGKLKLYKTRSRKVLPG